MFSETWDLVNIAVGPHEQKRTTKMIEARKELDRLTNEASAIADSHHPHQRSELRGGDR
jgi:hypothetical protein